MSCKLQKIVYTIYAYIPNMEIQYKYHYED